jgi:hypothetical protein
MDGKSRPLFGKGKIKFEIKITHFFCLKRPELRLFGLIFRPERIYPVSFAKPLRPD